MPYSLLDRARPHLNHHAHPLAACLALSATLWFATGCSALEPAEPVTPMAFPISLSIRGGGDPIEGARVSENHSLLGATGATGVLELALDGAEGETASLTVQCPDGFASPPQPLRVGLRHLAAGSPAPRFEIECIELVHTLVAGVRAENGARLPIVHLNQVVGHTDDFGVGHVQLEASDDQPITLTLDTHARPDLLPQNPTLTFMAPPNDALVLLEQKFSVKKAPPVKRRPAPMPTRVGAS